MSRRMLVVGVVAGALALALAGCGLFNTAELVAPSGEGFEAEYILTFRGDKPEFLEADVAAAGGTVRAVLDAIGVALVTAHEPGFAAAAAGVNGVSAVIADVVVDWVPGDDYVEVSPEHIGSDETFFYAYQWSMMAIDAPGAWDAGFTGDGVKVAVLDSGIDHDPATGYTHPDLAPNLNLALSRSFVPYEPTIQDFDGHGTHVSGIVAAADNDWGSIGVAPNAEIVTLKVLDGSGSGSFGWLLEALIYASTIDVDVVTMSLGAYFRHDGYYVPDPFDPSTWLFLGADEVAEFVNLVKAAINEVWKSGAFVVASAGNDSINGTGDAGLLHLPSDACSKGITASATGPLGWALDPTTDLDVPAVYTNYGANVDLAAPGGNIDFALYPNGPWYYDLVFSTYPGSWAWMAGTSQAAPHIAGVAALIIEANGGSMKPSHVETVLRRTADDLGAPGFDPFYGHGRINAAEAVK